MTAPLTDRIRSALSAPAAPAARAFAARLGEHAGALGVLFYGSNLRTGSLDGVLDFYVLLPGAVEKGIWPRVSYQEWRHEDRTLRAKVATMTLATFAAAARGDLLDTTIWARFVQPSALVWTRDEAAAAAVTAAVADAARTAARFAVALGPEAGVAENFWRVLFRATYRAEFRIERAGRENDILDANREHFAGLLPVALDAEGIDCAREGETLRPLMPKARRDALRRAWRRRARWGKAYNLARLVRASTTFEGAGRYAAWKIERHTGIPVALTPWKERHPVLAAPGVLWRLWRTRRTAR